MESSNGFKDKNFSLEIDEDALSTADLINARGMKVDQRCQTCGGEDESINHILFEYSYARQVWDVSTTPNPKSEFDDVSVFVNLNFLLNLRALKHLSDEHKIVWLWLLSNLWKRSNEMLFKERCYNDVELVQNANQEANEWFVAQLVDE